MKIIENHPAFYGFDWDEKKYHILLHERQIDLFDMAEIFESPHRFTYISANAGNDAERFVTIGVLNFWHYAVIYIMREHVIRIITARRAHAKEERYYGSLFS